MPQFRTFTREEVAKHKARRVNVTNLYPYMDYLRTLHVGDFGEITIEAGESRLAVKRRTTMAAKQLSMAIKWRISEQEKTLLFEVLPIADEGLIDRAGKKPELLEVEEQGGFMRRFYWRSASARLLQVQESAPDLAWKRAAARRCAPRRRRHSP